MTFMSRDSLTLDREDKLLEPVARGGVDLVALAKIAYTDGDVGHGLESSKW